MKLPLFVLLFAVSTALFSQQCSNDSLLTYPAGDFNYTGDGFGDPDNLPCVRGGAYSELVIPFTTYDQGARSLTLPDSTTVPVAKIYSVRIDNVTSLPSGLCWAVRPSNKTVTGEQVGMLIIKGTTSVASDIYPIGVTLSIDVQGSGTFTYTNLAASNYKAILGQAIVKVADSNNNCPSVN